MCRHPHIQTFPQVFVSTHLFTILWTSVFPSFFGCSGLTGGEALSHSWADNVLSGDRSVNKGSSSRSLWNYIRQKHNHPQNVMEGSKISGSQGRLFSSLNNKDVFQNITISTMYYIVNMQKYQPLQIPNNVNRSDIFDLDKTTASSHLKLLSHICHVREFYSRTYLNYSRWLK